MRTSVKLKLGFVGFRVMVYLGLGLANDPSLGNSNCSTGLGQLHAYWVLGPLRIVNLVEFKFILHS